MVRLAVVVLVLEILGALSLVAGVASFRQSADNEAAIVKLNAALDRDAANARAAAKAAAATSAVTKNFFDEINYICAINSARASAIGLPPAPAGICQVHFPKP